MAVIFWNMLQHVNGCQYNNSPLANGSIPGFSGCVSMILLHYRFFPPHKKTKNIAMATDFIKIVK